MSIPAYLSALEKQHRTGIAREHSYRGDLQSLLGELCPGVTVTNDGARIACGAPDYILTKQQIPVGYIEAKDIGVDLDSKSLKEQLDRYRGSLDNLIVTDYLEFRFFRDGEPTATVRIAELVGVKIKPRPDTFEHFNALILDFASWQGQSIDSPTKLAAMMAGKARLLADVIGKAVSSDEESQANTTLREQLAAFKQILIHDITPSGFADLYSQTIAYGMFAARLHDTSPETFTRMEAATLIPKSNPFLRRLFQSISGYDLDERIAWIVDALADIFRATDISSLLKGFGKDSGREDAFMHFYEDFLAQYDPKLRKSRGVWYTPDAVVRFMVRAVDQILKDDFGLGEGLADSSKVRIKRKVHSKATPDKRSKGRDVAVEVKVHRVQVLDPATGTGTFLAEIVRQVYATFSGQEGMWANYVDQHLLPRLNGFELLMASYAMAHLKMDLVLRDTGYDMGSTQSTLNAFGGSIQQQRLRVFLTNSLEEAHPETGTLFASWLSDEANQANAVKRDSPVMVVVGNPPYSGISSNMGEWISGLIDDYKYVDGEHFAERKHWLHDDYVKFIRFGEYFIERTGEGVLAYINNHGFLDNPTFRGMRWHLLQTFDKICIIDLHGNANKKESAPDGGKDENVFDIQQGVSINLFVRTNKKKKGALGQVFHADLFGKRRAKYTTLLNNSLDQLDLKPLNCVSPYFFFQPTDERARDDYSAGFAVNDLFGVLSNGVTTARDGLVIDMDERALEERMRDFADDSKTDVQVRLKYFGPGMKGRYERGDTRGWRLPQARIAIAHATHRAYIRNIAYRPFDQRSIYYHDQMVDWGREKVMRHFLKGENVGLTVRRQQLEARQTYYFVASGMIADGYIRSDNKGGESIAPLYLYQETAQKGGEAVLSVEPNLSETVMARFAAGLGLSLQFDQKTLWAHGVDGGFTPLDVFDYCYAVLYSPAYRAKYKDLLKSAFPRIPFPTAVSRFRALVRLGAKLRGLHLLDDPEVDQYVTHYPVAGTDKVTRKISAASPGWAAVSDGYGKVWINDSQFFDQVPVTAWELYIGGYQPAQKWLKDRHGRTLTFEEIRHYQRMIVALSNTVTVMDEIDHVGVL